MQRTKIALALLSVVSATTTNFADRAEDTFNAVAEYRKYGDCLALSPQVYGRPGDYFQSDI